GMELCGMASTPLTYRQRMTPCSSTTKRAVVSRTPKRLATSGRPSETICMVAWVPAPTAYIPASSSFTGSQCAESRITSTLDPRRSDNFCEESAPGAMSAKSGAGSPMASIGEEVCIGFVADTCTRNLLRRCKRRADCNVFCQRPFDRLGRGIVTRIIRNVREASMKHWQETSRILQLLLSRAEQGRAAALATVIHIEGSAY